MTVLQYEYVANSDRRNYVPSAYVQAFSCTMHVSGKWVRLQEYLYHLSGKLVRLQAFLYHASGPAYHDTIIELILWVELCA
jgi:hypothetical protein